MLNSVSSVAGEFDDSLSILGSLRRLLLRQVLPLGCPFLGAILEFHLALFS